MTGASKQRVTQADRLCAKAIRESLSAATGDMIAARHRQSATDPLLAALEEAGKVLRYAKKRVIVQPQEVGDARQLEINCGKALDHIDEALATITAELAKHKGAGDGQG
jgi:hypothetical protein